MYFWYKKSANELKYNNLDLFADVNSKVKFSIMALK